MIPRNKTLLLITLLLVGLFEVLSENEGQGQNVWQKDQILEEKNKPSSIKKYQRRDSASPNLNVISEIPVKKYQRRELESNVSTFFNLYSR